MSIGAHRSHRFSRVKPKRERVLHTTPKEKKAVANKERIHNLHLGLLDSELCRVIHRKVYSNRSEADFVMPSVIPSGTENLPLVRCTLTRETVESGSSVLRSVKYLENREYSRYLENVLQARIQVGEFDPSADFRSRAI
jgi:hypothetical protein